MVKNKIEGEYKLSEEKSGKHVGFQHSMMFLTGLLIVLVGIVIVGMADISQAADTYVDDNAASGWYGQFHVHTIQEGINNASAGDTVYVWNGIYTENINVNKRVSIIGNGSSHSFVNVSTGDIFSVTSDHVNISGFRITGPSELARCGIKMSDVENCSISDNIIQQSRFCAIILNGGSNNTISNNTINSTLSNAYGIRLDSSLYNTISNNTARDFSNYAILLYTNSHNNSVINNTVSNSNRGIYIMNNNNNTVRNNTVNSNNYGVYVYHSDNNMFTGNNVSYNTRGIYLTSSNTSTIYNNYFRNTNNAFDDGDNHWNTTKTVGTNKIGGPYCGGNYWSGYTGTDQNGDGLGDTNYSITGGNNADELPLVYGGIIVDDDFTSSTPGWNVTHFDTIQKGVDNVTTLRNTVYVWNGTYYENVDIIETLSIVGNSSAACIVNSTNSSDHVMHIASVDWVNISGLTVENASTANIKVGFYVEGNNISINSSKSHLNYYGFWITASSDVTITNTLICNNSDNGFYFTPSASEITLDNNTICFNGDAGIELSSSSRNTLSNNTIYNNTNYGIFLTASSHNIIDNNTINNNTRGVYLFTLAHNNTISNCSLSNNNYIGLYSRAPDTTFTSCSVDNSSTGLRLYLSANSTVSNCTITNSSTIGLSIDASDNYFYNNYLSNTVNVNDSENNTWNHSKSLGTNIVDGPYMGGNYWSDYTGADTDHDGLGDTNYSANMMYGADSLPLVISPEVLSTSPTNASTGQSRSTDIVITFSKSMNQTTVQDNLTFSPSNTPSWSNNNTTLTINPDSSLSYSTEYTVTIDWNATDSDGNVMLENYSFSFTTESYSGGGDGDGDGDGTVIFSPTADANGPYEGNVGESITFDGSGSSDSDGTIEEYSWDFGDGAIGSGVNPTHAYTTADTYTVTLTVTDNDGYTDTDTSTVTIESLPPNPPVADANGPYVAIVNQEITFDGSGSSDSDGTIVSYTWLCGDGSTVNGVSPTHSYTSSGTYGIKLTVTDNDGLSDNATTTAAIYDGESVDIPDGYVIDTTGDGVYDSYLNESSGTVNTMQKTDEGNYLIDDDNDGTFDEEYNPTTGDVTQYSPEPTPEDGGDNLWLYVAIIAIVIIILGVAAFLFYKKSD